MPQAYYVVWSHLEPTKRLGLLTSILSSALSLAFSYASFDVKKKGFDGVVGATSYSSFLFLQVPEKSKQHGCQHSVWDWLWIALKKQVCNCTFNRMSLLAAYLSCHVSVTFFAACTYVGMWCTFGGVHCTMQINMRKWRPGST